MPGRRMLAMTATVKAMETQRWVCRIHLFQFNGISSEDWNKPAAAHPGSRRASIIFQPFPDGSRKPASTLP